MTPTISRVPSGTTALTHNGIVALADAELLGGPAQDRHGQEVAENRAEHQAECRRDHGLRGVGAGHLRRGEAQRLQNPDAPDSRGHSPADHDRDDQHRHEQPEDPEADQERHVGLGVAGRLLLRGQVRLSALDRAGRCGGGHRLLVGGDVGGGPGLGEPVEHLLVGLGTGSGEPRETVGGGEGGRAVGHRVGEADDLERRLARQGGEHHRIAEAVGGIVLPRQGDLARARRPAPLGQRQLVHPGGAAQVGPGGDGDRTVVVTGPILLGAVRADRRVQGGGDRVRPGRLGDAGGVSGGGGLRGRDLRTIELDRQVRPVPSTESVLERGLHDSQQAEGEYRGRHRGERRQGHDEGLDPTAAHAGAYDLAQGAHRLTASSRRATARKPTSKRRRDIGGLRRVIGPLPPDGSAACGRPGRHRCRR